MTAHYTTLLENCSATKSNKLSVGILRNMEMMLSEQVRDLIQVSVTPACSAKEGLWLDPSLSAVWCLCERTLKPPLTSQVRIHGFKRHPGTMESQSSKANTFPLTALGTEDTSVGRGHVQSTTAGLRASQKSLLRAALRPL